LREQNSRGWEWRTLEVGGLLGLIIVLLANILSISSPLTDIFAVMNILLFICVIFSPFLLIYAFLGGSRLSKVIAIISYVSSALLIGFMIAYLARGEEYYSRLIVIPNEISWSIVAVIAMLLLIPGINILSSIFIAMWLCSLIYWKVYMSSLFYRILIGSPLFVIPLLVALGCEISRTAISRRSMVYTFDKMSGALTRQRPPKVKVPVKKLLSVIVIFLILGLMTSTAFGVWNVMEEANIVSISGFHLSIYSYYWDSYQCYLDVSFSLLNARGKLTAYAGVAELSIFNKDGSIIFSGNFAFKQESFIYYKASDKWVCIYRIPGEGFFSSITSRAKSITEFPNIIDSVNSGYATLKVILDDGRKVLVSTIRLEKSLDIYDLICFYFRNDFTYLQAELNKQWPFKAMIRGYFKMGNYCWMLIERPESGTIIISPYKIYRQYILQSTDGGRCWNIMWKSDNYGYIYIEIFNMKTFSIVRISTPYAIFVTEDEGRTWCILKYGT
jgi:hypothetical protein